MSVLLPPNIQNHRLNSLKILWEPSRKPETNLAQYEQERVEFSKRYWLLSNKYKHHFEKF